MKDEPEMDASDVVAKLNQLLHSVEDLHLTVLVGFVFTIGLMLFGCSK